ncbi:hypothetical protein DV515_00013451, partial [Chloebia gouldiae]
MFFHTPTDTAAFLDKEEDDGTQMRERNGLKELGYVGLQLFLSRFMEAGFDDFSSPRKALSEAVLCEQEVKDREGARKFLTSLCHCPLTL